jgi:hypothetical protein
MIQAFRYWLDNMGDHTVVAWACAVAHVVAGLCSWHAAVRSAARSPERTLWASVGVLLLALGVNKQLDLQILAIKEFAALYGQTSYWGTRRFVAGAVLTALGVAGVGVLVALGRGVRLRTWPLRVMAAAAAVLVALVLARGTTGAINSVLSTTLYGSAGDFLQLQVKDALELCAASVIAAASLAKS